MKEPEKRDSGIFGLSLAECIRKVSIIDIKARRPVRGSYSGKHLSVFCGRGIDFTDIREYMPGDDIRSIDWKTTARFQTPYLRLFSEDRDNTYYLLIDRSASHTFGREKSKEERMLEISASLIFSAEASGDAIGVCMFTKGVEKFIQAQKGRNHSVHLLNSIITYKTQHKGTDLACALKYMHNTLKRRSVIIIISDFDGEDYEKELSIISKKHVVYSVCISDEREHSLPDIGLIRLRDPETGEIVIADTSDETFRKNYADIVQNDILRKKEINGRFGIRTLFLDTNDDYESKLSHFFLGKGEAY